MISFTIWVTEKCNLACRYCYEHDFFGSQRYNGKYSEDVISFIKEIASLYCDDDIVIMFHGGEPLLEFDIVKQYVSCLQGLFQDRVSFCITTNGILMNDAIAEYLVKNFVDISVSLDGNKSVNDRNRVNKLGQGTYDLVMANLEKIPIRKDAIRIRMTITADSVEYFYESIVDLVAKGFTFLVPVIAVNDNKWDDLKIDILYNQVERLLNNGYGYLPFLEKACNMPRILPKCNGGIKSFNISVNNKIYPCEYIVGDDKFCIGEVGDGVHVIKRAEEFAKVYYENNDGACSNCSYSSYCDAVRCKFHNYANTSSLLVPSDNQCRAEQLNYRIWREFGCRKSDC